MEYREQEIETIFEDLNQKSHSWLAIDKIVMIKIKGSDHVMLVDLYKGMSV